MYIKQFNQFLCNTERLYNGYIYDSYQAKIDFSLTSVLNSKKKKLALTLFYCLDQETRMDDSWKLI